MYGSSPASTPIEASSTSVAVPPQTDPDSLTTVAMSPSVVIVPTQVAAELGSGASDEQATASNAAATSETRMFPIGEPRGSNLTPGTHTAEPVRSATERQAALRRDPRRPAWGRGRSWRRTVTEAPRR